MIYLTTEQAQQIEEALEDIVRVFQFETGTPVEALAVIRAARAHGQAETPFQLGQRLAREGQGISAIVYEIERDSDFDECLRGMRSVWNGDNPVEGQEPEVAPDGRVAKTVFTLEDTVKAFEEGRKNGLIEARAQEQAEQEPVSISDLRAEHHKAMLAYDIAIKYGLYERNAFKLCDEMKKLYAAPVRTKDLTDDEIAQAVGSPLDEVYLADFRAVIAADREKNNV